MSRGSIRAVRVLCHAQHFKGIGHFVRMHAIARGMSEAHDVYLVDGGRPVPRRPGPRPIELIEAFRGLRARGALCSMSLFGFPSPDASAADIAALSAATCDGPFRLCEFTPDFDAWLAGSALSISRCGYNTAVQLLQARVRSVLVPNPDNTDQPPRARRLAKLGLAAVIEAAAPPVEAIATAIEEAMALPTVEHSLDLNGVAATQTILEELVAEAGPSSHR